MSRTDVIATESAPAAIGPYSQALAFGELVFTSGQIGMDPVSGALPDGGVAAQARVALANLGAVLAAAGSGFERVLKTTVYLVDMGDFAAVNAVYAEAFGDARPARATVAVAGLPKGALFEIDAVATRG